MMTISEMRSRKEELFYTYDDIAEKSGLPVSTVQKVLCGVTKKPRRVTMEALDMILKNPEASGEGPASFGAPSVGEEMPDYKSFSGEIRIQAKTVDCWNGLEASDKWPRQGSYTVEDIYSLPVDVNAELIDGFIYDMSVPSKLHQRIVGYLFSELSRCIEEHGSPCEVFAAPSAIRLDNDNKTWVEPDIQIRCLDDNEQKSAAKVRLVAEVLSPSTKIKDCTIKLRKYMNAGISEYWIIDPENERVLVYLFASDILPKQYSFDDVIPVGISDGGCSIDFHRISERLTKARSVFGDEW